MSYDTSFKKKQQVDDIETDGLNVKTYRIIILIILGSFNSIRVQIAISGY